jgi:MSHA biogenesis protein MshP
MTRPTRLAQHGLGAVTVILVLVVLTSLAAAVLRLGQQMQGQSALDLQSARAQAAARAGIEWGLYQAFKGAWTACSSNSQTLDLAADGGGMRVTVGCDSRLFNEGETAPGVPATVRVFTLDVVACSSGSPSTACPDATAATSGHYVERRLQVQAVN